MKRIHKKGKKRQKALQKSASRMARDLLRAPVEKKQAIVDNWVKNRSAEEKEELAEMLRHAVKQRDLKTAQTILDVMLTNQQTKSVVKGLKRLAENAATLADLKNLKRVKASYGIILRDGTAHVSKLRYLEANLPKNFAKKIRDKRKEFEETLKELFEIAKRLDKTIHEWENQ